MQKNPKFGKIPYSELIDSVFRHLGVSSEKVILGPKIGEDAAIIKIGSKAIVISTDPITGATNNIGWLSVHVNANDVASHGVKPSWYLCSILLSSKSSRKLIRNIMNDIDKACRELEVTVVGGHSEVTLGLDRPIVIGTMLGETDEKNFVTSSGAKPGDKIILTKSVGLEGTAILATDFYNFLKYKIDDETLRKCRNFLQNISIVDDALTSMKVGSVNAMHDLTEGGVINGLWEIAEASNAGLKVYEKEIPVTLETKKICEVTGINFLGLLSSGSLLICSKSDNANKIVSSLEEKNIPAFVIGEITKFEEGRYLIKENKKRHKIKPLAQDEIYRAFGGYL